MNAKIGFALLYCLFPVLMNAQSFETLRFAGGLGEEAFTALEVGTDAHLYVSGTYNQTFEWEGHVLPVYGDDDIFLACLDGDGFPLWVLPAGSTDVDYAGALASRLDGGAYWGGVFWEEIQAGSWQGLVPGGGKGMFVLSVDGDGLPQWGEVLYGPGAKGLQDLGKDAAGNLYATGYFGGQLILEDTTLEAAGDINGFVAKWDPSGNFQWASRFGDSGSVRGESLVTRNASQLYLGGRFNGSISLVGTTIQANTFDDDGFVAALSTATGEALWLRKAGGQYDDAINALALNNTNELFATGTFVGVLKVDEDWTIQTEGFNNNFFLIRYNALDGTPEWAQSLGNANDEQALTMGIRNEGPVVAGLFRNTLTLSGQTISGLGEGFNGFVAGFRPEGDLRWLEGLPGDDLVIPEAVAVDDQGAVWLAGGFSGTAWFEGAPVPSLGIFDAWVGKLDQQFTATFETPALSIPPQVFPNPATDRLFVEGFSEPFSFRLFRPDGVKVRQGQGTGSIDISDLPPGLYFLQIYVSRTKSWYKFPVFVKH